MKNFIALLPLVFFIACTPSSILDKKMQYIFYEKMDYKLLIKAEDVSDADLFLINYAIIRQRDYFNYTVEGKTYREILAMAKGFQKNGLPVEIKLNDNGAQDKIQIAAVTEGVGFVKKKSNTKRVLKTLKFKAKLDNPSKKDVVLLNSSFIVKGPFNDYLTTVNYEINCIAKAETTVDAAFVVPGKTIQRNLLFEGNPYITRLGIDEILNNLTLTPSGMSIKDEGRYFKECFFNASRMEPQIVLNFGKDLEDREWKIENPDGTYTLNFGNMHTPDESDEVIQYR